jgi:hypothetical protein
VPVTICWSAKGGSGTTVVAAALALAGRAESLLVDLDGELPAVLGLPEPTGQGISDWLASDAVAPAVLDLALAVDRTTSLVPRGTAGVDLASPRWPELIAWLDARGHVVIDAGTTPPHSELVQPGVRSLLVTRGCYLALRRAVASAARPHGIVLVAEPGRSLRRREVEQSIGAPVVATVSLDPAVARAVDAGLLNAYLPKALRRELRGAA